MSGTVLAPSPGKLHRTVRDIPVKLNPDSLATHLEQHLLPVYLVSGDEPLLTGEAADAIRARARAIGFTEREAHFLERGSDWDDVRASAGNMSLFGSRRVVEIRLPSGKPGVSGNKALVALLEHEDRDTVFLILTPRLDRDAQSADWVKAVEAHGAWVQVWPIDIDRLVGWLRGRSRRLKLDATDEALELLAERTEGNLLAAHQELEKLTLLAVDDESRRTRFWPVSRTVRGSTYSNSERPCSPAMRSAL